MTDIVAKPFSTRLRRFAVGDPVRAGDDLAPLSYASLVEHGLLVPEGTEKADAERPRGRKTA